MITDARRGAHRCRWGTALIVVVVALSACEPAMPDGIGAPVEGPVPAPRFAMSYLTRDGSDRFDLNGGTGTMVASAPSSNQRGNTRALVVSEQTPASFDQESCAAWTDVQGSFVQQGVALRVRQESGGPRAITVTRNIFGGAGWIFNVHVWAPGRGFEMIGQEDLRDVVGSPSEGGHRPFPWHICARAVGDRVEFKVWTGTEPTPAWGNARHGGVYQLPVGWVYAGRPGGYVGHLPPDGSASSARLRTADYPRPRADAEAVTRALYGKAVRHAPTPGNVELWKTRLQDGWSRQRAAQTFATGVHGRRVSLDDAHRLILSRGVDPSGLRTWSAHLDRGNSYRSFIGALGNAAGFANSRAGNEAYAAHIWQATLGRPIPASERTAWADRLAGGWTRRSMAEHFWTVPEARNRHATVAFTAVVGRAPTVAERNHWSGRFVSLGADPARLRAEIVIATVALPSPNDETAGPPVVLDASEIGASDSDSFELDAAPPTTVTPPETTTVAPPTTVAPDPAPPSTTTTPTTTAPAPPPSVPETTSPSTPSPPSTSPSSTSPPRSTLVPSGSAATD